MFQCENEIEVQFGDCDPAAIVFFPNYFRWFDQCFNGLLRQAAIPIELLRAEYGVVGFPLLEAGAKFLNSSTVGDRLTVTSRIVEVARKTVRVQHLFTRDGLTLLDGWEVRVWAGPHPEDAKRIKADIIPEGIVAILSNPPAPQALPA